mmetsp:Transcript_5740/g.15555  ORF Transcript_5740/g.15555 Transcript_5740/m.15555 type:complete len:221 (-) Transcript_5740:165-827(-)
MPMPEPFFLAWSVHAPGGRFEVYGGRLTEPDRITAPVRRQIAVSALLASSFSSNDVDSSLPLTLFTTPYSSTNDLGRRMRLKVGTSLRWICPRRLRSAITDLRLDGPALLLVLIESSASRLACCDRIGRCATFANTYAESSPSSPGSEPAALGSSPADSSASLAGLEPLRATMNRLAAAATSPSSSSISSASLIRSSSSTPLPSAPSAFSTAKNGLLNES